MRLHGRPHDALAGKARPPTDDHAPLLIGNCQSHILPRPRILLGGREKTMPDKTPISEEEHALFAAMKEDRAIADAVIATYDKGFADGKAAGMKAGVSLGRSMSSNGWFFPLISVVFAGGWVCGFLLAVNTIIGVSP